MICIYYFNFPCACGSRLVWQPLSGGVISSIGWLAKPTSQWTSLFIWTPNSQTISNLLDLLRVWAIGNPVDTPYCLKPILNHSPHCGLLWAYPCISLFRMMIDDVKIHSNGWLTGRFRALGLPHWVHWSRTGSTPKVRLGPYRVMQLAGKWCWLFQPMNDTQLLDVVGPYSANSPSHMPFTISFVWWLKMKEKTCLVVD